MMVGWLFWFVAGFLLVAHEGVIGSSKVVHGQAHDIKQVVGGPHTIQNHNKCIYILPAIFSFHDWMKAMSNEGFVRLAWEFQQYIKDQLLGMSKLACINPSSMKCKAW
mmetsp:Transcript_73287/g.122365  ORF Transcript_73287/g.122365 Transcript_73287/m.122365 type:complete len:108 (+) Transcript_73287:1719-2042(+)